LKSALRLPRGCTVGRTMKWDEQMKRDVASGKLDDVLREVEDDIRAGRLRDMP
jgi:hypothetical protein